MTVKKDPLCKIFTFQPGSEVHAVVIRELFVRDDIEIGIRCDQHVSQAARGSIIGMMQAQKREAVRLSIVAIQREEDGQWERVNEPTAFMEMDDWQQSTYAMLLIGFNELNGASEDEFFTKRARVVSSTELLSMIGHAPVGKTAQETHNTERRAGT